MSVVIIGGNERMVCRYKEICRQYNCEAKVFIEMPGNLKSQIGAPDLIVVFTNTASHMMVECAMKEAVRNSSAVLRSHSSSSSALKNMLSQYCAGCAAARKADCGRQSCPLVSNC